MPSPYAWPLDPDALAFVPALTVAYVLVVRRVPTERWRYACLLEALDRGRVTVVAPLYATESLWAVLFAALLLRSSEAVGRRLVAAAVLMVLGGALIGISR